MLAERAFIDERGLNGRPWYKHEIYAPGIFTGYASQPLTDFRQALDDRNTSNLKSGLGRIVAAIDRATEVLKKARD
jgi:N-acetylated-alpha-linked acidic dipeptidase